MSGESTTDAAPADAHLAGVEDGCGCAEVWEHLSERREADRKEASVGASDEVASREADRRETSAGASGVPVSEVNGGSSDRRSDGDAASRDGDD